jgi:hypothetical protein
MSKPHDASSPPASPLEIPGQITIGGNVYMTDAGGRQVPIELVKPADLLKDQVVRDLVLRAVKLSGEIAKFRESTLDEMGSLQDVLAEQYGVKIGGIGGNISVQSFDGTLKVEVQINKRISYGPEIQAAKAIVDECLLDWGKDSPPELRAIVADAFNVDQQGKYNRTSLVRLKRLDIKDPRWVRAMEALSDAETPDGSKTYARFHKRPTAKDKFGPVSLDAASA